jgi:wyosine [tRNA(Phe)-imidazoG37] synthetase (radical SAM superfamily)
MDSMENKCVYGPVDSWRLGRSLGIDVLCIDSICSFACVYCQLGKINRITSEQGVFVETSKILEDLRASDWQIADVITFSGSGEPTLAANLGEAIAAIRELTGKPIAVLTNSTLLWQDDVRREISLADRIFCKLDAWSDDSLRRIDRPAPGITLETIIEGIKRLRSEFRGFLAIQTMLLGQPSESELRSLSAILREIGPDEVELNLPLRPIPEEWHLESRGNNTEAGEGAKKLRSVTKETAGEIGKEIARMTGLRVITPFDASAVSPA